MHDAVLYVGVDCVAREPSLPTVPAAGPRVFTVAAFAGDGTSRLRAAAARASARASTPSGASARSPR